ncbi:Transcription factor IIIA [Dinochytrium kinnereticum]|nr:Transcription factor IIIA [Dinochytrium kinnereticum]
MRYACGVEGCDGRFSKWSLLQSHIKSEHPIVCPTCRKPFLRRDTMREHMLTHDEDRELLPCPWLGCEKSFAYRKNLNVHIKAAHEGIRQHACDFAGCEATFSHKHLLSRHKRLHEEEPRERKKRKDTIPEPTFFELMTGAHYVSEESGRNIPCLINGCDYAFRRQYDLERHMKSVHYDAVQEEPQVAEEPVESGGLEAAKAVDVYPIETTL